MSMAWVRIHDGAMQSMKIALLSHSAFRLWVRGLCYCQTALTDGLIPSVALRDMGARTKDVSMLSTVLVPDTCPLWEAIDGFGFRVHDYLDWNDSRETVLERQAAAKARTERWRSKRVTERVTERVAQRVTNASGDDSLTKPNQSTYKNQLIRR